MINAIRAIDGYEGMSDAAIAETLKASGVTARPIDRAELLHLLNMRGMLRKVIGNSADEKWTGTVLNMQDAILAGGTAEQIDGIRLWFSHVTNPSNTKWDTTEAAFSAAFWQMFQLFADAEGMPTSEDFNAIAALGGGWKFSDVTAEDVTASREAHQAEAAEALRVQEIDALRVRIENDWLNPAMADGETTAEQVAAAIVEGLG